MPPLVVVGHLCLLPRTPTPAVEVIDVAAEKQAVLVILPAPICVQPAHGRRVRVAGGDDQSRRWFPGAGRFSEGRDA